MTEPVAEAAREEQGPTTAAWVVAKLREGHGIVAGSDRARATADLLEEMGGRVAALRHPMQPLRSGHLFNIIVDAIREAGGTYEVPK